MLTPLMRLLVFAVVLGSWNLCAAGTQKQLSEHDKGTRTQDSAVKKHSAQSKPSNAEGESSSPAESKPQKPTPTGGSKEVVVQTGFLILNGQAMSAPFEVTCRGGELKVNDVLVENALENNRMRPKGLVEALEMNDVVVINDGWMTTYYPRTDAGELLLHLLTGRQDKQGWVLQKLNEYLAPGVVSQMAGIAPCEQTQTRAIAILDEFDRIEDHNQSRMEAVHRIEQVAYPMTMFGMIVSVIAFGHLLLARPDTEAASLNATPQATQMVVRSIAFVVLLSALDLVWTLMAWQAGQMKELNPFASHMIDDPMKLVLFKAVATLAGAALLLSLRQYRQAQLASWWMCLVCTVLTFRWLTFHSMMIG